MLRQNSYISEIYMQIVLELFKKLFSWQAQWSLKQLII